MLLNKLEELTNVKEADKAIVGEWNATAFALRALIYPFPKH